jgi:type I restriction enzyme S subunit
MATLGSVCRFLNGGTPSKAVPEYFKGDIPWITSADISGTIANYARSHITEDAVKNSAVNKVAAGAVLLVTRTGVGKVAVAANELCFSQDITALLPDDSKLGANYLVHFLRTKKDYFLGLARGATIQGITRNVVSDLSIPLPPLPEQRRIAAILDQADALRAKRREALVQLDSLTQSMFIEMFGDAESQDWSVGTIADIASTNRGSIRTGPFGSQLLHSEFVDDGIAVLGIDNAVANEFRWGERRYISEAKYRELKRYKVNPGDVLITIMGTCGRCAVVPDDVPLAINTKHLCCITLNPLKCKPAFLHAYFLLHPMAKRYLNQTEKGAIMAGLNMGLIKAMSIPIPPLTLQQTFATRIQSVEALKATHNAALQELDRLFASLQHRAFQGEL